jgi:glycosyltransferase involved in cell wall biosynthesis
MTGVLRIAFHVECLFAGPLTGVGQYAARLMNELAQDESLQLLPFVKNTLIPLPYTPPAQRAPPQRSPLHAASRRIVRSAFQLVPPAGRELRNGYVMQKLVRRLKPDIYHDPNHNLLASDDVPTVLTVHDLSVMRFPHWHPPERVAYFARRFTASVRRARIVLVVSEQVKRETVELLGVPAERVHVTPLAAGEEFHPRDGAQIASVLHRFGLRPQQYSLFIGTREPRKNLDNLLDAWEGLSAATRGKQTLVLVGPPGWHTEQLEHRLHRLETAGLVRRLGYVPDAERPMLYAGARAFFYPSLYEGFGLPPLEAAACGVPVVTSTGTPMATTLAGVALLVDPLDTGALREALRRSLEDDAWRAQASKAGPERAGLYSWADCAALTKAAYRIAARG